MQFRTGLGERDELVPVFDGRPPQHHPAANPTVHQPESTRDPSQPPDFVPFRQHHYIASPVHRRTRNRTGSRIYESLYGGEGYVAALPTPPGAGGEQSQNSSPPT
ncbi:hypothetical protein GCM10010191_00310 [Actinomadura vinacea]|uniref:Uncharacterized protein n=1 Tax=Actinomadura vinacea TaxID=115336 RepID=A0ABN3IA58_9ACTN